MKATKKQIFKEENSDSSRRDLISVIAGISLLALSTILFIYNHTSIAIALMGVFWFMWIPWWS